MSAGNGPCNTVYLGDPAVQLVDTGWSVFSGYAAQAVTLANSQIQGLTNFYVPSITWNPSWQAGDGALSGFIRPARPDLPDITVLDLSGEVPDAPSVAIDPVTLDAAPAEPFDLSTAPSLDLTVHGPELTALAPGAVDPFVTPDAPTDLVIDFDSIEKPELVLPFVPDAPLVTIDEFSELAPEFTAAPPSGTIDFVETPYVSAFLDAVKTHLQTLMDGQALPPEVEAALWSRALDRDEQLARAALQEVDEDFAARGFGPEPNGMLLKRRLMVRQESRNRLSDLNRQIYVQNQTVAVENIRFAVTQGINLEGQMIQLHLAVEQRKFDLAVKTKDVAIAVFTAEVTAFNAVVASFNARIEAYKAFLEGQKARVDVFKSQVEAAKLQGDLNEQNVRVYEAQFRAEAVRAEVYRAQIEGYRARIEAERARIDAHQSEVDVYRAFIEAYKVQWDAERTRIDAEARKGDLYQTMVQAYAGRVDIWKTQQEGKFQQQRANIASAQAFLQQHDAQVRTVLARVEALKATIQAQGIQSDAIARMYQADAALEGAAVDADTRVYQAQTDRESARLQMALKNVELNIQQLTQNSNLLLRAMESASQASTQLAASSMSAVNFSAGVSSSASRSESCSTSFSYSGEIADA